MADIPTPLDTDAARQLRQAVHWSGPKCYPDSCPGVDECCYAEDDGTGPDTEARWNDAVALLASQGWGSRG